MLRLLKRCMISSNNAALHTLENQQTSCTDLDMIYCWPMGQWAFTVSASTCPVSLAPNNYNALQYAHDYAFLCHCVIVLSPSLTSPLCQVLLSHCSAALHQPDNPFI